MITAVFALELSKTLLSLELVQSGCNVFVYSGYMRNVLWRETFFLLCCIIGLWWRDHM